MLIGIPKEAEGQALVSAAPDGAGRLVKLGYDVCIESGAGVLASYNDYAYDNDEVGARVVDRETAWGADIVLHLDMPSDEELDLMKEGAVLICRMNPFANPEVAQKLADRKITGLSMDAIPRISRAQSMDVRSSMMNISGYRAVIEAAAAFGRTFGGQVTAAGKSRPARVYVIGVGVAGLAAIGQASSMGAEVFATDVRAEVADQVESLGGTFVEIPVKQQSADGYAKPLTEEEQQQVLEVYAQQAALSDIVITTAAVPGRKAPLLLTEQAVAGMRSGSVVVDMGASDLGGNCAVSQPDQTVVTENGVKVLGPTRLPSRMPRQASQLYGQNIANLFKLATPGKDGVLVLDQDDPIIRGITVALDGQVTWPPPAISVSAAPKKEEKPAEPATEPDLISGTGKTERLIRGLWWKATLGAIALALVIAAPEAMTGHFFVFVLSCVIGFYVITNVTHTLHTPLMSVTNAISGIIIVGAILQITATSDVLVIAMAAVAIAIASINIFGGFLVTHRMLKMFERSSK